MKGRPEHPFAEQIEGPDKIPPPLFAQPLLHWLANFISSGASPELETVEQALALEPPRNGNFRLIEWDHSMLEKPVFPKWTAKVLRTSHEAQIRSALTGQNGQSEQASPQAWDFMRLAERSSSIAMVRRVTSHLKKAPHLTPYR